MARLCWSHACFTLHSLLYSNVICGRSTIRGVRFSRSLLAAVSYVCVLGADGFLFGNPGEVQVGELEQDCSSELLVTQRSPTPLPTKYSEPLSTARHLYALATQSSEHLLILEEWDRCPRKSGGVGKTIAFYVIALVVISRVLRLSFSKQDM